MTVHWCISFSDELHFRGSNKSFSDRGSENRWICGAGSIFVLCWLFWGWLFFSFLCLHACAFYGRWCQISSCLRGYSFLKVKAVPVTPERIRSLWVEWLDLLSSQVGTEPVDCISQVCNKSYSYSFLFLRVHLSQNPLEILQVLAEDGISCLFRKLFCAVLYVFFFSPKCMKTFGRG